eukprot:6189903-Pleurochrysis_carterae.AAC.1
MGMLALSPELLKYIQVCIGAQQTDSMGLHARLYRHMHYNVQELRDVGLAHQARAYLPLSPPMLAVLNTADLPARLLMRLWQESPNNLLEGGVESVVLTNQYAASIPPNLCFWSFAEYPLASHLLRESTSPAPHSFITYPTYPTYSGTSPSQLASSSDTKYQNDGHAGEESELYSVTGGRRIVMLIMLMVRNNYTTVLVATMVSQIHMWRRAR